LGVELEWAGCEKRIIVDIYKVMLDEKARGKCIL
jgi:hypothetical protein